jgi:hypothetical protein
LLWMRGEIKNLRLTWYEMESFIRIIHFGVKLFLLLLVAPTRGGRNHSKRERERKRGIGSVLKGKVQLVVGKYDSLSLSLTHSLSLSLSSFFLCFVMKRAGF